MPFALLMAGWSDFHSRRKTLLFSLVCIIISIYLICHYGYTGNSASAFAALIIKAIGGNAIPVALASLVEVVPAKRFRSLLAITICAYSAGSWVPIHFRDYLQEMSVFSGIGAILCFCSTYLWFKHYGLDAKGSKAPENGTSIREFFPFLKKEIFQIGKFIIVPMVALCFGGFIFSEISFYQILLRGEVLPQNNYYSFSSITLAGGYYIGTLILFLLGWRKIADSKCIKCGAFFSLGSILTITILNKFGIANNLFYMLLIGSFSAGFAIFIPSIFSHLSKMRHENEQGKIYGLLESSDSFAFLGSTAYIKSFKSSYTIISLVSLILFSIGFIIFHKFSKINNVGLNGKN
jgi:hypothetical protein